MAPRINNKDIINYLNYPAFFTYLSLLPQTLKFNKKKLGTQPSNAILYKISQKEKTQDLLHTTTQIYYSNTPEPCWPCMQYYKRKAKASGSKLDTRHSAVLLHLIILLRLVRLGCEVISVDSILLFRVFNCQFGKMANDVLHLGIALALLVSAQVVQP